MNKTTPLLTLLAIGFLTPAIHAHADCVTKLNSTIAERLKGHTIKTAIFAGSATAVAAGGTMMVVANHHSDEVSAQDAKDPNYHGGNIPLEFGQAPVGLLAVGSLGLMIETAKVAHDGFSNYGHKVEELLTQAETLQLDKKTFQGFFNRVQKKQKSADSHLVAAFLREGNESESFCQGGVYASEKSIAASVVDSLKAGRVPKEVNLTVPESDPNVSSSVQP